MTKHKIKMTIKASKVISEQDDLYLVLSDKEESIKRKNARREKSKSRSKE